MLNYILTSRGFEYGNYFWFFIFGMGSFYLLKNKEQLPKILNSKYILIFILVTSTIYLFLGKYMGFDYYIDNVDNYLYNNLIASFLIVTTALILEKDYYSFNNKLLILFGNASYSIYLTHYILIHYIHDYYDKDFNNIVLFIGSIVLGILTYKYMETPMMQYFKGEKIKCVG